jgi:hypothetical protein
MTPNDFRILALGFPGAVESAHMHHPDFRIEGKIFATLGYPDGDWGMVKLTPEQQRAFVKRAPEVFHSCRGVWGERGATNVHLASARKTLVQTALRAAFRGAKAAAKKKTRTRQSTRTHFRP